MIPSDVLGDDVVKKFMTGSNWELGIVSLSTNGTWNDVYQWREFDENYWLINKLFNNHKMNISLSLILFEKSSIESRWS